MRLRDILSRKVVGNAHDDALLLVAIDAYVGNKRTPTEGKLAALRKMDDVMGLQHPADEAFALGVYMSTRAEYFTATLADA